MDNGWIKIHRKTIECGFFNNPNLSHFWLWCLLKATHKPYKQSVGFQVIDLLPGQFIFGRNVASEETGLSVRTIRTCQQHLVNLQNVTIKATNKFSIITISNWATYQNLETQSDQQSDQHVTSRRPADDHKQEHKNIRRGENPPSPPTPFTRKFITVFKRIYFDYTKTKYLISPKEKKLVNCICSNCSEKELESKIQKFADMCSSGGVWFAAGWADFNITNMYNKWNSIIPDHIPEGVSNV
jgi:hypothetical protein